MTLVAHQCVPCGVSLLSITGLSPGLAVARNSESSGLWTVDGWRSVKACQHGEGYSGDQGQGQVNRDQGPARWIDSTPRRFAFES